MVLTRHGAFFILLTDLRTDPIDVEERWSSDAHPSFKFPALYEQAVRNLDIPCGRNFSYPLSTHVCTGSSSCPKTLKLAVYAVLDLTRRTFTPGTDFA